MVAEPYAALFTVQDGRPVLHHNSIQGLHYYAMGAIHTQASTLLVLLVLTNLVLHPQVQVYMLGQLETRDKAPTTTATEQLQSSQATTTSIHRQTVKLVLPPEPS